MEHGMPGLVWNAYCMEHLIAGGVWNMECWLAIHIKNEKMCMLLRLSIYLVSTLKLHILAKISSL